MFLLPFATASLSAEDANLGNLLLSHLRLCLGGFFHAVFYYNFTDSLDSWDTGYSNVSPLISFPLHL
jgi:hypothetical protein